MFVACLIGLGGIYLAITLATDLLQMTLMFSISFGACNGLAYTLPLKVGWDYFPDNKGTVSGIIVCGFGLGSLIFGFLSTMIVNPNNT